MTTFNPKKSVIFEHAAFISTYEKTPLKILRLLFGLVFLVALFMTVLSLPNSQNKSFSTFFLGLGLVFIMFETYYRLKFSQSPTPKTDGNLAERVDIKLAAHLINSQSLNQLISQLLKTHLSNFILRRA